MIQVLRADRDGLLMFTKPLEPRRFICSVTRSGKVHLILAELSMLPEGINLRHPQRMEHPGLQI